jgi:hypothetical protein
MALDAFTLEMAGRIGLSPSYIESKVTELLQAAAAAGLDLGGNVLAGFDLNGPLTRADDAQLTPFPGTSEIIRRLAGTPRIYPAIITGWDTATVTACVRKMGLDGIGVICERGMLYLLEGQERFLYPQCDAESHLFMATCWRLAAGQGLKIAFQGNRSSGSQAIMVEADQRAGIAGHPAVNGRVTDLLAVYRAACGGSDLRWTGDRLIFRADPANMAGLHAALTGPFALSSLRAALEPDGQVALELPGADRADVTLADVAAFSERLAAGTGRVAFVNPDYGVDFLTRAALDERYSKENAARTLAARVFGGQPFAIASVGDKEQDIISGPASLYCAQAGSEVCALLRQRGQRFVEVQDGRDYALALYEAQRRLAGPTAGGNG